MQRTFLTIARLTLVLVAGLPGATLAQENPPADRIAELVRSLKDDPRGPFDAIRWYCPDGRVLPPAEPCGIPGGVQHGRLKPEVRQLAERYGIWIGQVLAATSPSEFLDAENGYARARQYQVERFLERSDDGWIWRRARFYRGAVQAEDEERSAVAALRELLADDVAVRGHFLGSRDLVRDLPTGSQTDLFARIRADAATVAAEYAAFADLRVKLHGQPDSTDRTRVRAFGRTHRSRMSAVAASVLDRLEADLAAAYEREPGDLIRDALGKTRNPAERDLLEPVARALDEGRTEGAIALLADALLAVRVRVEEGPAADRLRLLRMSLDLEALLFRVAAAPVPSALAGRLARMTALARGAAGTGYLERWEWNEVAPQLFRADSRATSIPVDTLRSLTDRYRRIVEWGVGSVQATYGETVSLYYPFEPLASRFVDDRLRASILLHLGRDVAELADLVASATGGAGSLLDLPVSGTARGVNPGYAMGRLEVVQGDPSGVEFLPDRIYVMDMPPADLKPVAGILSVSEGNVVSHVQLLARNLGIPNAVVSTEQVRLLQQFEGEQVFLAVSPGGVVRLVRAREMTEVERGLVTERGRTEQRIGVPTDRLDLGHMELTDLRQLRAVDSGRICGPKAANLGQLGALFPGRVSAGFIVPFGAFRQHMDQAMPGAGGTYWAYLARTFAEADLLRRRSRPTTEVDRYVLGRLDSLRRAVESMPLLPDFVDRFRERFRSTFGSAPGSITVFVRSDTNMEDLADFTGAGLNLTVPNVLSESDLFVAIRRVWASPYRERGYQWRQRYLLNPEDVYPSLLILRSVNADLSGVLITTGIDDGESTSSTAAVNRGVGGAVDGQAAETWLLEAGGKDQLVAPARERSARRLPVTGGLARERVTFERPILSSAPLDSVRALASAIRTRLPGTPGMSSSGPYDVEFGMVEGRIVLFQVRPFVENRNSASEAYMSTLDASLRRSDRRFSLRNPGAR